MRAVDRTFIKRLAVSENQVEQATLRRQLKKIAKALNEAGRYRTDDVVHDHGYENVVRCLAMRIVRSGYEFDQYEKSLAASIPQPPAWQGECGYIVQWHPAFIQQEFLRLIRPNIIE